jgi:outer membrane immunogenic protein
VQHQKRRGSRLLCILFTTFLGNCSEKPKRTHSRTISALFRSALAIETHQSLAHDDSWQGQVKLGMIMNRLPTVFTASAAAAIMSCGLAYAADLAPATVYRPAPVMSPVPAYNWTGVYVGLNGGGAWGSQDPYNIITNRFDHLSTSISGGLFGGTVGAQVQVNYVVLGLEADLDWANIKGSTSAVPTVGGIPVTAFPINAETKIDWESTARLRAGMAFNNIMAYITGGLALQGAKTTLTSPLGPVCGGIFSGCSGTDRAIGAALGAGIEYGFTPSLSAKVEFLYVTGASIEISRTSEIRGGLNYRFTGF